MAEEQVQTETVDTGNEEPKVDDISEVIKAEVEKQVKGLKENNTALKEEKKKVQQRATELTDIIESLGGADEVEKLKALRVKLEQDEELKLFAEGSREEYNDRLTNRVKADADAKVQKLQDQVDKLQVVADQAVSKYQNKEIDISVNDACASSGVIPRLFGAVKGQIMNQLHYDNESNAILVKDNENVRYGKDGSPMKVEELVELMREDQPELFTQSTGSGSLGMGSPLRSAGGLTSGEAGQMSMQDYIKARKEGRI